VYCCLTYFSKILIILFSLSFFALLFYIYDGEDYYLKSIILNIFEWNYFNLFCSVWVLGVCIYSVFLYVLFVYLSRFCSVSFSVSIRQLCLCFFDYLIFSVYNAPVSLYSYCFFLPKWVKYKNILTFIVNKT
jgi:hypothetical protein